jgi:predicted dehydrogenase
MALSGLASGCGRPSNVGGMQAGAHGAAGTSGGLPPEQRVGFALVGLGKLTLGQILPQFAHCKLARPTALVSGDRAKAERTAKQYGVDPAHVYDYASFDRIRDDPRVDVVYVVLPNSMHAEYTIRAARAGKHVLCEKPMANSVEECRQMIAACEKAKRHLMIAYRMQYEPRNREAIRIVRSGALGKLKNMISSNGQMERDPNEWRLKRALAGGGPLPDVGIYSLNAARYLTGEEPVEVSAIQYTTPGDPRFEEVEEQIDFTLRFPSGVLASCATSYNVHPRRDYHLMFERGRLDFDPAFAYGGLAMSVRGEGKDGAEAQVELPRFEDAPQFALEMDHMAQCVRENRRPHTPGEEGMQDMRIIEAIYEAARTRRNVELPPVAGLDAFRGPPPG